jgi:hypothetical protein
MVSIKYMYTNCIQLDTLYDTLLVIFGNMVKITVWTILKFQGLFTATKNSLYDHNLITIQKNVYLLISSLLFTTLRMKKK